ncbi:hypothetical protein CCACVL1_07300 [Corchorus capsularis]|uniref:Uncharacterized protein n=1 Tax=Corchorus capsularis TaxID=210143 RepID=A0A1R3J7D1_COCAP|nr:hypothetical protein CCACVL1_07300 [Corchorus capsularis]
MGRRGREMHRYELANQTETKTTSKAQQQPPKTPSKAGPHVSLTEITFLPDEF